MTPERVSGPMANIESDWSPTPSDQGTLLP